MSLYLKYRPQDFHNLVGQEFINETLKKAIAENKTVGAYLLCGPRGTGKTSTARILAKTLNCEDPQNGNPCLKCAICRDFLEERLIDIIEIDAASHTGVDNVRDIIEKAQFQPTRTHYKIYIIDEVHMLSKGAFNALLKILEEPPKHVKFILATTETHKVPDTILSRCQRYDFKRIANEDIKQRLLFIAQEENVTIDENSLQYIIKNAGGGLRNAISLFEQLIENGKIIYDEIIKKLGGVQKEILENFLHKLIHGDTSVIHDFDELIKEGKNIKLFFKELIFFTKESAIHNIQKGENIRFLLNILEELEDAYIKTKHSLDENTTFLIGILKLLHPHEANKETTTRIDGERKSVKTGSNKTQETGKREEPSKTQETSKIAEPLKKQESGIDLQDIGDVFGNTPTIENNITQHKSTDTNIDKEGLITCLKNLGAKGGLTMNIRSAKLEMTPTAFIVTLQTNFALKAVDTTENRTFLLQGLEKMGYETKEIILQ